MKKIILASSSPRRKELLKLLFEDFDIIPSEKDEQCDAENPADYVMNLSKMKALEIAKKTEDDCYVIGADTVVVHNGYILGKPVDEDDAFNMLKNLTGDSHYVYTGVAIVDTKTGDVKEFYEKTEVFMFDVSDEEIKDYIKTKDPLDKAGGYGIQSKGAFLVSKIDGDFYNVVGLPLAKLYREIKDFDKDI